ADDDLRRVLMLAVLAHDFGKPSTTVQTEKQGRLRWTSPAHGIAGLGPTESFLQRIGAPHRLAPRILPLVQHHLAHIDTPDGEFSDAHLRRLSRRLEPASLTELLAVMRADARGRPPTDPAPTLATLTRLEQRSHELALRDAAPRPLLQGRHLIARGLTPGPDFSPVLAAAYDAQLDGAFSDEEGSLNWLDQYLKRAEK